MMKAEYFLPAKGVYVMPAENETMNYVPSHFLTDIKFYRHHVDRQPKVHFFISYSNSIGIV